MHVQENYLPSRIEQILTHLNSGLFEREETIRLCVLAALAGESVFLLGPPGVAKSLIARRLKLLFDRDVQVFDYLMNRFSTPDEIFGPVSIKTLADEDVLRRQTENYLPDAVVVFLDEIWKAGPSIQNTLLTVLNEKLFRNAGREQQLPLELLVSASNELPARGEGLEALWDRFLIRLEVLPVRRPVSRHALVTGQGMEPELEIAATLQFTPSELAKLRAMFVGITVPDLILHFFDALDSEIQAYNRDLTTEMESSFDEDEDYRRPIYFSDRRRRKIGNLLRASALLNGRDAVNIHDCFLLSHCIWDDNNHRAAAPSLVLRAAVNALRTGAYEEAQRSLTKLRTRYREAVVPVAVESPKPFPGHYKLDLKEHADLLTSPQGTRFARLIDDDYISLKPKRFSQIKLKSEKGQSTELEARREDEVSVTLRLKKTNSQLQAFSAQRFPLILLEGRQRYRSSLEINEIRALHAQASALKQAIVSDPSPELSQRHLFVSLTAKALGDLRAACDHRADTREALLAEVEAFLTDLEEPK